MISMQEYHITDSFIDKYSIRMFVKKLKHYDKKVKKFHIIIDGSVETWKIEYFIKYIQLYLDYDLQKFNEKIEFSGINAYFITMLIEVNYSKFNFPWRKVLTIFIWTISLALVLWQRNFSWEVLKFSYDRYRVVKIHSKIVKIIKEKKFDKDLKIYYNKYKLRYNKVLWEISDAIYESSLRYDIKENHIIAIMYIESSFKMKADKKYGKGLMQVNTLAWKDFDSAKILNSVDYSVNAGTYVFKHYMKSSKEYLPNALVRYNGGRVLSSGRINFIESQQYVMKFLDTMNMMID